MPCHIPLHAAVCYGHHMLHSVSSTPWPVNWVWFDDRIKLALLHNIKRVLVGNKTGALQGGSNQPGHGHLLLTAACFSHAPAAMQGPSSLLSSSTTLSCTCAPSLTAFAALSVVAHSSSSAWSTPCRNPRSWRRCWTRSTLGCCCRPILQHAAPSSKSLRRFLDSCWRNCNVAWVPCAKPILQCPTTHTWLPEPTRRLLSPPCW